MTELPFFATKVRLGRGGAEEILPLGPLNDFERYPSFTLGRLIMWFHSLKLSASEFARSLKFIGLMLLLRLWENRTGLVAAKKELSESIQKGIAFMNK